MSSWPGRRITLNGHTRHLGAFTAEALVDYLAERRLRWPHTINRYVLISRRTAGGINPVSAYYPKQYLLQHGVRLEDIRMDRVLDEALVHGPDPLDLALMFGMTATTAIRYAEAARRILDQGEPGAS